MTMNQTSVVHVSANKQLLSNRAYLIGYRIVLSFLIIYVIPMITLLPG